MITQLTGKLLAVVDGAAHVECGAIVYEVLVPAADSMALAAGLGATVRFHTLHYLEGQGQGSSFWPRLIGFQSVQDREFFELFTTVKGIGNRKALRALQLPFAQVAEAVAARDLALLQSLPEIGKRTAEAICVELKGKVERFAAPSASRPQAESKPSGNAALARSAVEVLVQLGHTRQAARELVDRALARAQTPPATAEELVTAALA
ncbi:MAG: Holliday junction branch migration protein RuvA [Phycisphaerales bacterium]